MLTLFDLLDPLKGLFAQIFLQRESHQRQKSA